MASGQEACDSGQQVVLRALTSNSHPEKDAAAPLGQGWLGHTPSQLSGETRQPRRPEADYFRQQSEYKKN